MIEPSSADLYSCPEVVQEYIQSLEQRLAEAMKTIYRCTCQNNGG